MVASHVEAILSLKREEKFFLDVIVGMTGKSSLSEKATENFGRLNYENAFFRINIRTPSERIDYHSKLYVWFRHEVPVLAWGGSANYTRLAFGLSDQSDLRDEVLFEVEPELASNYATELLLRSASIGGLPSRGMSLTPPEVPTPSSESNFILPDALDPKVFALCPIVNRRTGKIHNPGAGINWGQPTSSRVRNDVLAAYIPVPSARRDFFPTPGIPFEVQCPDGRMIVCSRQQQSGKAISSSPTPEILGSYLREVLGVPHSGMVSDSDLESFGSNCVVFEKLQNGFFALHFYPGLDYLQLERRIILS